MLHHQLVSLKIHLSIYFRQNDTPAERRHIGGNEELNHWMLSSQNSGPSLANLSPGQLTDPVSMIQKSVNTPLKAQLRLHTHTAVIADKGVNAC